MTRYTRVTVGRQLLHQELGPKTVEFFTPPYTGYPRWRVRLWRGEMMELTTAEAYVLCLGLEAAERKHTEDLLAQIGPI